MVEVDLPNQVARHPEAVTVVTGIVGCAGLKVHIQILTVFVLKIGAYSEFLDISEITFRN